MKLERFIDYLILAIGDVRKESDLIVQNGIRLYLNNVILLITNISMMINVC